MKIYNVTDRNRIGDIALFAERNLESVSGSILSIINRVNNLARSLATKNDKIEAWATTDRPTVTKERITLGINLTTNKTNHTVDGGTTWYNADGTAA